MDWICFSRMTTCIKSSTNICYISSKLLTGKAMPCWKCQQAQAKQFVCCLWYYHTSSSFRKYSSIILCISWQLRRKMHIIWFSPRKVGKLIYCTRTVPEMVKCMDEIKKVINYRKKLLGDSVGGNILAICLSARRNLCIHPTGNMSQVENKILTNNAVFLPSKVITILWIHHEL